MGDCPVIVLGIETATESVGAAVVDDSGVRASTGLVGSRRHAETLVPSVAEACRVAGITLGQVEVIAVDIGPGLFTGLRVGVAAAQALGFALGKKLLPVTSVQALASRAAGDTDALTGTHAPGRIAGALIVSVVDARRGEVFVARYRSVPGGWPGQVDEVTPVARFTPDALAADLAGAVAEGEVPLLVGDGALRFVEILGGVPGVTVATDVVHPDASAVATLAFRAIVAGAPLHAPAEVVPLYLRDAEVRINWEQRHPRPAPASGL